MGTRMEKVSLTSISLYIWQDGFNLSDSALKHTYKPSQSHLLRDKRKKPKAQEMS